MFHSLWFKLVGAFVLLVVVALAITMRVLVNVTEQGVVRFAEARTNFARSLLPTIPPIPTVPPHRLRPDRFPFRGGTGFTDDGEITIVVPRFDEESMPGELLLEEIVIEAAEGGNTNREFLVDVRRTTRTALMVAGLASILLGTIIFRQFTRPLENLRHAVQAFAQGDLSVRIPIKSKDEVGKVAAAFNHMASQLERQEQLRQRMVADVAHELRTPLSVMQGNIEAMMDGLLKPNSGELAELHDEVERLTRLLEDLRLLSLADAGQLKLTMASISVGKLIDRVSGLMMPLADSKSVRVQANIPMMSIVIKGDEDRLLQALTNLIDNGIRHTPAGGQVTVEAAVTEEALFISVADNGPGIPAEELSHLFERFWRGDKSRSRHSGGSGLGLSIVKQIAELHGGAVHVVSPETGGCRFTLELPIE
jgi:signal transduction histidine kinase